MVAKSFQSMEQITEPYKISGRMYVKVRTKTGTERQVRWYSEVEYYKMYPEEKQKEETAEVQFKRSQKLVLGFDKDYITIFKGDTYEHLDWFKLSIARYCKLWGWYVISTAEVPEDLPEGLTPIKLSWDIVGNADGTLKNDALVKQAVDSLIYDAGKSEFIGEIGERLDLTITVTGSRTIENSIYGHSVVHTMEDENGNVFIWITSAKNWPVGSVKKIRGTIKEHKTFKNVKQNILTRCSEIK